MGRTLKGPLGEVCPTLHRFSACGTKREFGQGHFRVGKPTHCRLPTPSVGLPLDGRPDSERQRKHVHDPKRKSRITIRYSGTPAFRRLSSTLFKGVSCMPT